MQPLEPAIRLAIMRRSAALLALLLLVLWPGIEAGRAEGYPDRTVKIVVPFPAGAVNDGLRSAEVRASLDAIGVEPRTGTPEAFAAMLDEQARQWKAVIEEIGIKAE